MRALTSLFRPHLLAALGALLLMATPASAQSKPAPAPSCPAPGPLSQVFARWADPAFYYLAVDGSFEKRAWSGGTLVAGNEPHFVGSAKDKRSMSLAGAATSPRMCITLDSPTVRLFARQTAGGPTSTLGVTALVPVGGQEMAVAMMPVPATGDWLLTPPTPILANFGAVADIAGLLDGRPATRVRFVLTASAGSVWQVDDFYVDPYKRN
jgi:hypothetical protein